MTGKFWFIEDPMGRASYKDVDGCLQRPDYGAWMAAAVFVEIWGFICHHNL